MENSRNPRQSLARTLKYAGAVLVACCGIVFTVAGCGEDNGQIPTFQALTTLNNLLINGVPATFSPGNIPTGVLQELSFVGQPTAVQNGNGTTTITAHVHSTVPLSQLFAGLPGGFFSGATAGATDFVLQFTITPGTDCPTITITGHDVNGNTTAPISVNVCTLTGGGGVR